MVSVDRFWWRS